MKNDMRHDDLTEQELLEMKESMDESLGIHAKESDFVLEGGNDTRRLQVNKGLDQSKINAINTLKDCRANTSPEIVADLLSQLFENSSTKPGWWLHVAQHWPPRAINRTITVMLKLHRGRWITLQDPAKYFTYSLKFRKQRMIFQKRRKEKRGISEKETHEKN